MVPGVSLHLWNIKFVENRPRIIISMKSEVAYLGRKGYSAICQNFWVYYPPMSWVNQKRISIKIQKSEVSSKITNLSFWVIKMKSLGVQNNWENRKFVVEKSQFYWVMFRMLSILPLPLSLIVPTIRIESWVFNGIAHVKAGVSRYYYGLKFVKENVSKQVEKMVEKCQGLLQKSSAKTQHTLLLFPIFENLSYGATWPRLLLGVWSCGHH